MHGLFIGLPPAANGCSGRRPRLLSDVSSVMRWQSWAVITANRRSSNIREFFIATISTLTTTLASRRSEGFLLSGFCRGLRNSTDPLTKLRRAQNRKCSPCYRSGLAMCVTRQDFPPVSSSELTLGSPFCEHSIDQISNVPIIVLNVILSPEFFVISIGTVWKRYMLFQNGLPVDR